MISNEKPGAFVTFFGAADFGAADFFGAAFFGGLIFGAAVFFGAAAFFAREAFFGAAVFFAGARDRTFFFGAFFFGAFLFGAFFTEAFFGSAFPFFTGVFFFFLDAIVFCLERSVAPVPVRINAELPLWSQRPEEVQSALEPATRRRGLNT
jgi:hypothetical protein